MLNYLSSGEIQTQDIFTNKTNLPRSFLIVEIYESFIQLTKENNHKKNIASKSFGSNLDTFTTGWLTIKRDLHFFSLDKWNKSLKPICDFFHDYTFSQKKFL